MIARGDLVDRVRAQPGSSTAWRPPGRSARRGAQSGWLRIRPLVGTAVPAVTSVFTTSGTWLTDVPRIWRTPFGDAVHPVDVRLAELAAVGVDRQAATELDGAVGDEVLGLALRAEPELLELGQHERREVVVDRRRLDVVGAEPGRLPQLAGHDAHLGDAGDVVAVVAAHHVLILGHTLGGGGDDGRLLGQICGALGGGDQQGLAAVGLLAAVEQVQRLDDPARFLMVFEGDGLVVEERLGIGGGVLAVGDGHTTEVLRGRAGLVHVAGREHRHPLRRGQQAERRRPAEADVEGLGAVVLVLHALAEAVPGPFVERPVAQHVVGSAGVHGLGGQGDGAAGRAAAVVDHREVGEFGNAEVAGHLDLGVAFGGVHDHAVRPSLGSSPASAQAARQASVASCMGVRPEFFENSVAPMPAMAVLRANSSIRRSPRSMPHGRRLPGRAMSAVPVTWAPRLLRPMKPDGDGAVVGDGADRARHGHGVVGIVRGTEADLRGCGTPRRVRSSRRSSGSPARWSSRCS